ncbi:MAG: outer membrane beta-barrel protein [candidate division Zixibacteria bacterium]|nr:outer membrane beta-barrel protein [candidate division Zixibacteria bacterium]MBU1470034.1 outer membrane beta-barrel protein [candidate division Zixibacteria bacterium]MBU2625234.1 outer membrane beta-barrel protein [candidate division Zixibacteria bacterium]
MKRAVIVLTILVLFGTYSTADAQFGKIITLGGGISSVQKPDSFSDYYKRGYNGSAALGFGIVPGVSIHAMIEYNSFPLDTDKIKEIAALLEMNPEVSGDDLTVISGFVLARVRLLLLAPGSSPYAIGGVGLVRAGVSNIELAAEDPQDNITIRLESETATAITVGAGFDFGFAPKTSIFIEGRYVRAFFKDDNFAYIPIKAGLNISL